VCRPAGDEFVIVLTGERGESARHLSGTCAHVAKRIEAAVRQPVVVDGGRAQVGVSVGFAAMIGPGRGAEHLLRTADRAMYRQKGAPSRAA